MKSIPLWRQIQKQNLTRLDHLIDLLELSDSDGKKLLEKSDFSINIPLRLLQKMEKGTLNDPILRQFVPFALENDQSQGESTDPLHESSAHILPRLLHKYPNRALLLTSSACAMHCRYCFRKQFPYSQLKFDFSQELEWIRSHPTIHEVILSGGDPLSLSDENLGILLSEINSIPHVRRLRWHTRFPIGIPERIDLDFVTTLNRFSRQMIFVLHINHPREIDAKLIQALSLLKKNGIPLLSQSVLLHHVNDDEKTLLLLCETLIDAGIIPYYLFLRDPVLGTAHFDVPQNRADELIAFVQERLSGYGVPRLAREIAGRPCKSYRT